MGEAAASRGARDTTDGAAMPLYTYACRDHGEFSDWGRMSESDAPHPCPACSEPARRALARPAIGGRGGEDAGDMACGMGACGVEPGGAMGGGCGCGAGGCAH